MSTFNQKLAISLSSAVPFVLVSLPQTYGITNMFLNTFTKSTNCPTALGILLHTLVFFLISYYSMRGPTPKGLKAKFSFYGALIFFLVSNPVTYQFVRSLIGPSVASAAGCPTLFGILLHALVYAGILTAAMYFPPELE